MPNEKDYRRPDAIIDQSVAVTMSDGTDWYIPKPSIVFEAHRSGGKLGYRVVSKSGDAEFDDAFGKAHDAYLAAGRALEMGEPGADPFSEMFAMFEAMIARNYVIPDEVWPAILRVAPPIYEDPVVLALLDVAKGRNSPKPSPGGDFLA